MRTALTIAISLIFSSAALSSERLEIGVFGGASYYMGDINMSRHFYNPSPSFGALIKYNLDDHYSVRAGLNYGGIGAYDSSFGGSIHQERQAGFFHNFFDISLQGEFNFSPFRVTIFARPISTYVTAGVAYMLIPGNDAAAGNFNIPFGGGVKYGLSRKFTVGLEWVLKKSFSDDIDGVKSFGQFNSPSLVHNNDWVSLTGFFITIKPFERRGDCPVYWN